MALPRVFPLPVKANYGLLIALALGSCQAYAASLDDLDKAEFDEAIAKARQCLAANDPPCAATALALAKRRATSGADRALVEQLQSTPASAEADDARQQAQQRHARDVARREQSQRDKQEAAAYAEEAPATPSAAQLITQAGAAMNQNLAAQLAQKQRAAAVNPTIAIQPRAPQPSAAQVQPQRAQPPREAAAQQQARPAPAPAPVVAPAQAPVVQAANTTAPASAAPMPQALAFCWQTPKGLWACDGPSDETSIAEKDRAAQLQLVGCTRPTLAASSAISLTSTRVSKRGTVSGWLFDCGKRLQPGNTGQATWNRDIRRFWSGIVQ